jgi:peptidoglycan hydrolase-like protein with peptidoglycan-binding domain
VRRSLAYALIALTVATGSIVLGSSPAFASLARCSGYTYVWDFTRNPTVPESGTEIQYGSAPGDNVNCENVYGDYAVSVSILQISLNQCYGPSGEFAHLFSPVLTTEGQYGPRTTAAVRAVQQYIGVGVDGRAGPVTRIHMAQWDYKHVQCTMVHNPILLWPN